MDNKEITQDTFIINVICKKCQKTLPPHTIGQHLDKSFMKEFHKCENNKIQWNKDWDYNI